MPPDSATSQPPPAGPAVRPTDAWFRSIVEAANEGIWIIDLEAKTLFANHRMADMLGITPDELGGRTPFDFLSDEDRLQGADVMARNFEGTPVQFEIRFQRDDGSVIPVLGGTAPLRNEQGAIVGSVGTFSDLSERKASEQAREASERQARETATLFLKLLESSSDAIWMRDPDGRFQLANPPAARVLGGTSDPADIIGKPMADVWGTEFAAVLQAQTEALFAAGKSETVEERVQDSDRHAEAVFLSTKVPLYDDDGSPLGVLGVSRDITDMKRVEQELRDNEARLAEQVDQLQTAHQREQLLAREVDHRAKNLLAVVQSVVQLSRASSVDELKEGLTGRIQALARAHSLLADARWEGVELSQLANEELAPFMGGDIGRVSCSGPAVLLRPSAAQSLGLVLHELTTNAAKYGALSKAVGSLTVEWRLQDGDLQLDWVEAGGAKPKVPHDSGFGTRLVTTSIERQLRGNVAREWTDSGVRYRLRIPVEHAVVISD